jgi:D-glycero-D-manno-heptose 1,7-bisphosphate phosphatase
VSAAGGGRAVSAVFLDRDGTINAKAPEGDYVKSPEELVLLRGAGAAVAALNRAGIPVLLVTNQRGIALGRMSAADLERVHARLGQQLQAHDARLDGVYVCPHDRETCDCRKPQPGLLLRAAHEHGVELSRAVLVGDAVSDVQAAAAAGVRGILVGAQAGERARQAAAMGVPVAATLRDLGAAAQHILALAGESRERLA